MSSLRHLGHRTPGICWMGRDVSWEGPFCFFSLSLFAKPDGAVAFVERMRKEEREGSYRRMHLGMGMGIPAAGLGKGRGGASKKGGLESEDIGGGRINEGDRVGEDGVVRRVEHCVDREDCRKNGGVGKVYR